MGVVEVHESFFSFRVRSVHSCVLTVKNKVCVSEPQRVDESWYFEPKLLTQFSKLLMTRFYIREPEWVFEEMQMII
jgi:hypothetical protein